MNRHIDESGLYELKEIMEEEFDELLNVFVVDAGEKIAGIKSQCQDKDSESIMRLAHALKGSSAGVCAPGLSFLAKEVEELAKSQRFDEISDYFDTLDQEYLAVKQAFSQISGGAQS